MFRNTYIDSDFHKEDTHSQQQDTSVGPTTEGNDTFSTSDHAIADEKHAVAVADDDTVPEQTPASCYYRHFDIAKVKLDCELKSIDNAETPLLDSQMLKAFWDNYILEVSVDSIDPYISPLLAPSLAALPPIHIQVAGADPLRDEAIAFFQRLPEDGVEVEMKIYPGMPYAFQGEVLGMKSGDSAMMDFVNYARGRDWGANK
ncbi:hypothetical protein EJ08DRAFT_683566 [Tothia fuscella]|uniref:Alpha/beta hydrolase fold-3 domain-containing protein n=1 Tax=Tothia fuscella TaxID=1048955 RepID=A0A9P4TSW4_9PEZI|nr:hypothetical protein EJ08DRAFT_683566 [Tothia fuscella]